MIVTCPDCRWTYEDSYRWTVCPHETFEANDGQNNFAHHSESALAPPAAEGHFHPCSKCSEAFECWCPFPEITPCDAIARCAKCKVA